MKLRRSWICRSDQVVERGNGSSDVLVRRALTVWDDFQKISAMDGSRDTIRKWASVVDS